VADLVAALAESGQRCALPERGGTVGGAVAVGEHHDELLGRGTLRASVLEVRYVAADGRLVRGGGPTVKNVTGFDLPRLITGSLGTIGLVAEVVLRTNPVPAERRWIRAGGVDPFVVRDLLLRPGAILWDGRATTVLLEGYGPDVDADARRLAALGDVTDVEGPPHLPAQRWSLAPADLRHAATLTSSTGAVSNGASSFVASIGTGTLWADVAQPARLVDSGAAIVAARVKANFDPTGRLNPGRDPAVR
jgi:glycolate oxidase FAD binding subunit